MTTEQLLKFIPCGIENSISRRDLQEITGLQEREIRQAISRLRRSGCLICYNTTAVNGSTGYYIPLNESELALFVHTEQARINTLRQALKPAQKALKRYRKVVSLNQ